MFKFFFVLLILLSIVLSTDAFAASNTAFHHPIYLNGEKETTYFEDMVIIGNAVWYGKKAHGRRTASGEIFNMYKYTAAHRSLPLGTVVCVTNLSNDKSVIVTINDRGPLSKCFVIDLSRQAANDIDMIKSGIALVSIRILNLPNLSNAP